MKKSKPRPPINWSAVVATFIKTGNVQATCAEHRVSRQAFYDYAKRHKLLAGKETMLAGVRRRIVRHLQKINKGLRTKNGNKK